ncbi:hypothetical protein L1987_22118 [Smallanthus sonchifolius]|uniref:Uncharacterized protein n=1 Tax=Smallanthus sonchifolius TaxID=185202 RepID=A0ACB9IDZ8_9ASTR|nr:hypothetical protein L1987_22118 [Smallanthus sonchifolius]
MHLKAIWQYIYFGISFSKVAMDRRSTYSQTLGCLPETNKRKSFFLVTTVFTTPFTLCVIFVFSNQSVLGYARRN